MGFTKEVVYQGTLHAAGGVPNFDEFLEGHNFGTDLQILANPVANEALKPRLLRGLVWQLYLVQGLSYRASSGKGIEICAFLQMSQLLEAIAQERFDRFGLFWGFWNCAITTKEGPKNPGPLASL